MTLPPYQLRGILRLQIQPRRGLCRYLTLRRRGNRPKAVIWEGIHYLQGHRRLLPLSSTSLSLAGAFSYKISAVQVHFFSVISALSMHFKSPGSMHFKSPVSMHSACTSNHQVACTSNPQLACTQRILQYPQVRSTVLVTFSPGSTNPLSLSLQRRH